MANLWALEELTSLLSFTKSEVIILGDLNYDVEMQASDNLKEMCNDLNLTQLVTKRTWPNPKDPLKSTLIGLTLMDTPEKYISIGVFAQDISDHCPVLEI